MSDCGERRSRSDLTRTRWTWPQGNGRLSESPSVRPLLISPLKMIVGCELMVVPLVHELVTAVSVMCGVIFLISIGFAVWDYLSERDIRSKARKIVIASAAFDKQGRLLVRPDGHLPMHVIESQADLKVGSWNIRNSGNHR
jgi:hypothetical protein